MLSVPPEGVTTALYTHPVPMSTVPSAEPKATYIQGLLGDQHSVMQDLHILVQLGDSFGDPHVA